MCDEASMNYMAGSDVDFWKVARETTKEIQDYVIAERYISGETMLRHMMKPKEFVDLLDRELSIRFRSATRVLVSSILAMISSANIINLKKFSLILFLMAYPIPYSYISTIR